MNEGSKAFSLNWADIVGVAKNAALVGGAAALTALAQNLHAVDLGQWGVVVVPLVAVGLDAAIKWLKDNSKTKE